MLVMADDATYSACTTQSFLMRSRERGSASAMRAAHVVRRSFGLNERLASGD